MDRGGHWLSPGENQGNENCLEVKNEMRYQRVKMVVEYIVPVGRDHYGPRQTEAPWEQYAEHDMREHLRDIEEIGEAYLDTAKCEDISFQWGEQFEEGEKETLDR